jgi:hypothetical protein
MENAGNSDHYPAEMMKVSRCYEKGRVGAAFGLVLVPRGNTRDPLHFVPRTSRYITSIEQFEVPLAATQVPVFIEQIEPCLEAGVMTPFIGREWCAPLRQRQAFNPTLVFGSLKA